MFGEWKYFISWHFCEWAIVNSMMTATDSFWEDVINVCLLLSPLGKGVNLYLNIRGSSRRYMAEILSIYNVKHHPTDSEIFQRWGEEKGLESSLVYSLKNRPKSNIYTCRSYITFLSFSFFIFCFCLFSPFLNVGGLQPQDLLLCYTSLYTRGLIFNSCLSLVLSKLLFMVLNKW